MNSRNSDKAKCGGAKRCRLRKPIEEKIEFDPSTLCYFRRRLKENEAPCLVFDKIIQFAKQKRFVKKKTKQRVDATHIIAHVNRISTTDLLFRSVKCVVEEIEVKNPEMYEKEVPGDMKERYDNDFSSFGMSKEKRADKQAEIVEEGLYLAEICERLSGGERNEYVRLAIMEKIFEENIIIWKKEVGNKIFIEVDEIEKPKQTIFNPRDPEVKLGIKGETSLVGSKCHIVETATLQQKRVMAVYMLDSISWCASRVRIMGTSKNCFPDWRAAPLKTPILFWQSKLRKCQHLYSVTKGEFLEVPL